MSKLTVIIPSVDRESYLDRALEYWAGSDFEIIVVTNIVKSHPDINIITSQENFLQRITMALDVAQGEYCVLCPNDDFLGFNALTSCIQLLDADTVCSSVVGKVASFCFANTAGSNVAFLHHCQSMPEHLESSVMERVESGFRNYSNNYWVVYRKHVLKKILMACSGLENYNVVELIFKFGALVEGTIRSIGKFLSLRESIPHSWGQTESNDTVYMKSPANKKELEHLDVMLHRYFTLCIDKPIETMMINYGLCCYKGESWASFKKNPLKSMMNDLHDPYRIGVNIYRTLRSWFNRPRTLSEKEFSADMAFDEKNDLTRIIAIIEKHANCDPTVAKVVNGEQ